MLNGHPKSGITSLLELLFYKAVKTRDFEHVILISLAATSGNIEACLQKQGVSLSDLRLQGSGTPSSHYWLCGVLCMILICAA